MTQTNFGFSGTLAATDWSKHASVLLNGGPCVGGPSEARITAATDGRAINISAGRIGGDGVVTVLDAAERVNLPTPSNGQWFLVVNQRVWATKVSTFEVRNGPVTATTFGFTPPTSFPASLEANPGTKADVPVAWVWANGANQTVYFFPLLAAPEVSYPRAGTSALRDTTLASLNSNAPSPYNWDWAQRVYPQWFVTDNAEFQQYISTYDASRNPGGKATAGWTVVGQQSGILRYASESGLKSNSNALAAYGEGGVGYARDTDGLYYRRGDRVQRLDSQPFCTVTAQGTMATDRPVESMTGSTISQVTNDKSVFYDRSDSVIRVNVSGWYDISGTVEWQSNSSGNRIFELNQNDTDFTPVVGDRRSAFNQSYASVGDLVHLNAGDYLKLKGSQNSGGNLTWIARMSIRLVQADNPS